MKAPLPRQPLCYHRKSYRSSKRVRPPRPVGRRRSIDKPSVIKGTIGLLK
jgi:hypothetical protein